MSEHIDFGVIDTTTEDLESTLEVLDNGGRKVNGADPSEYWRQSCSICVISETDPADPEHSLSLFNRYIGKVRAALDEDIVLQAKYPCANKGLEFIDKSQVSYNLQRA